MISHDKRKEIKKQLVLIPSAYNHKVMGDIENFIEYYKSNFDVYIICDKYEDDIVKEDNVTFVNNNCSYADYLKITADYIIDAGSINGFTRVSKTQKRISVWHGVPYKNMFTKLDNIYYKEAVEYDYGMDLMVSPSKFYSEKFLREAMLYEGKILETAVSRTDSLFISEDAKVDIKKNLGIPLDKKILLYAPTFRKEGSFKLPFDPKKLKESLGDDWVVVTKLHYLNELANASDVIDCTNYSSVNNLLSISDFLITDYSSLFFDYSVLDKSIIFYQYDKDEYESDRGFMFNLEDYVDKKYIVREEDELYNLAAKIDSISNNLGKVKKEFYPHQKPNSTKELVKKLDLDDTPRYTKDIIFLVNELNQIGGVHNFVLNLAKEFKEKYNSRIIVIGKKEFAISNDKIHLFDQDNLVDIKLSYEHDRRLVKKILINTDGYVIGCQFGAFMAMQKYLKYTKAVAMFHGDTDDVVKKTMYKTHLETLNRYLIDNYKKLILLTKGNMDILKPHVNDDIKDKLGYIENGYDFSDRKNYYKDNGEFTCITRLDRDKNVDDIINLFSNKKLNKSFKLHVYGDGEYKKDLEDKVKKLKLEKKIIFHGYCTDKDEMYKDKQGLIMISLTEGFPYVILEAYKYGIPVYTYDSFTSVHDLLNDKIGKIIPTKDIDKYVEVLNKGFKVSPSSFDGYIKKFSNEEILKKWIKLFDELDGLEETLAKEKNEQSNSITTKIKNKKKSLKKRIKQGLLNSDKKVLSDIYIMLSNIRYKIKTIGKKKKEPLVSIVIPFYNDNEHINNTLKSIKKCGYKNYEVILVNDGSEENPESICKKYKNVRYFYKENEGPGYTRNFGIDKAKGKYIFFLDSDDEICKDSLSHLVDYAEKKSLNLVSGLCRRIYYNTKSTSYWYKDLYKKSTINYKDTRYKIINDNTSTSKLYNLKALKESNIRFEKGLYEDALFMSEIYNYFDAVGLIPYMVYTWYIYGQNTSISTTNTIDNYSERLEKFMKAFNASSEFYKMYYMRNFINHHMYIFVTKYNEYSEEEKRKMYDMTKEILTKNKEYIYNKLIYFPVKKLLVSLMLDDRYDDFYKYATFVSEEHFQELERLQEDK